MSCLYIHDSFPHRFNYHPNAAKAIGLKLQALAALRHDPELIEACGSVEIKHFPQCSSDSRHHRVVEARDRAFDPGGGCRSREAVDEQGGIAAKRKIAPLHGGAMARRRQ
jgi:hypothetical protein